MTGVSKHMFCYLCQNTGSIGYLPMETNLARELEKYYHPRRRSIVFRNGMTAGELALEMWSRLGERGFDQPTLSRILHGRRLFTRRQFLVFCELLALTATERSALYTALEHDWDTSARRPTTAPVGPSLDDQLDHVVLDLENVYRVKLEGNPRHAITMGESLADQLRRTIRSLEITSDLSDPIAQAYLRRFRLLLASNLVQLADCHRHIFPPDTIRASAHLVSIELKDIAEILRDEDVNAFSDLILGHAAYHCEEYIEAISSLERAIKRIKDPNYRLEGVRSLLISQANLNRPSEVRASELLAKRIIDDGNVSKLEMIYQAYEGIGRAYGRLNSDKAFGVLEEGTALYKAGIDAGYARLVVPRIQFPRAELAAMSSMQMHDPRTAERIAQEPLWLAREHGLTRFEGQIRGYLTNLLN
jgi:tetratricopeptide (TPR) repeat protein